MNQFFFSTFPVRLPTSHFFPPLKKCLNAAFLSPPGPRWASWNLGIFICIRCAGIHRNLGVHISKVKSVNLDQWTQEQVQVRGHTAEPNTTYAFQYFQYFPWMTAAGLQRSISSNRWSTIKTNTFALLLMAVIIQGAQTEKLLRRCYSCYSREPWTGLVS